MGCHISITDNKQDDGLPVYNRFDNIQKVNCTKRKKIYDELITDWKGENNNIRKKAKEKILQAIYTQFHKDCDKYNIYVEAQPPTIKKSNQYLGNNKDCINRILDELIRQTSNRSEVSTKIKNLKMNYNKNKNIISLQKEIFGKIIFNEIIKFCERLNKDKGASGPDHLTKTISESNIVAILMQINILLKKKWGNF